MVSYLGMGFYMLKSILFGVKFPIGISIDATYKCNLKCKHCYFLKQGYTNELQTEEMLKRLEEIKKRYPSIIHASWVGGEPLLRKNLLEQGMKLFPFNMVVTNGTIELPNWKNCVFNVSIDGTKEYYEQIRGKGVYDIVKKNIDRSNVKVNISCVLNKKNYLSIEDMLKEWRETKVGGVAFDFYTPIRGIKEDLWLNWEERDNIIKKMFHLKKKYKNFLLNPKPVLDLMLSKNSKDITRNCPLPKAVVCLDPLGKRKLPCVIGEKADCSKCGCIIPFFIESVIKRKQIKSLYSTKKGFT